MHDTEEKKWTEKPQKELEETSQRSKTARAKRDETGDGTCNVSRVERTNSGSCNLLGMSVNISTKLHHTTVELMTRLVAQQREAKLTPAQPSPARACLALDGPVRFGSVEAKPQLSQL